MSSDSTAYIGVGANLGLPKAAVRQALEILGAENDIRLLAHSSLWRTKPVDAQGPDFCNAMAKIQTRLGPRELMVRLLDIEKAHGRERSVPNAPRTLDLDIIAIEGLVSEDPQVRVPHPRAHQRAFVLVPLCEINPQIMLGPSPSEMKSAGQWKSILTAAELAEVSPW